MRLVRKIQFNRIQQLPQFESICKKFNEIKSSTEVNGIAKIDDVSKLNFYVVIEFMSIVDKIDYSKIFPDNNHIVDFNSLLSEQKKVSDYIRKKRDNYPEIFKKLGQLNEVIGCYIIATKKKGIQSVTSKNTINTISIKLDNNELPKETNSMCEDFYKSKMDMIIKEQQEFDRFLKLSMEEQDIIISNILQNIQIPPIIFTKSSSNSYEYDFELPIKKEDIMRNTTKIEDAAIKNIDKINSIDFLKTLLRTSVEREKYELCAQIRDRINILEKIQLSAVYNKKK